jgi:hypothetical protein
VDSLAPVFDGYMYLAVTQSCSGLIKVLFRPALFAQLARHLLSIDAASNLSYRGEACQHLDLDLVDLEVKCHFRIRKIQPEV